VKGLHVGPCDGCQVVTLVNRYCPTSMQGPLIAGHFCAECFDRLNLEEPRRPPAGRATEGEDPQLDNARRAWEDAA